MTKKDIAQEIKQEENTKTKDGSLMIEDLHDLEVEISVVLGRSKMLLSNILKLGKGSVIELNRMVGEPIDILANDKVIAKGEIVIVDDQIGVTITEITKDKLL